MKMKKYVIEVQVFDETNANTLQNVLDYAFDETGIVGVCYVEEVEEEKVEPSREKEGIRTLEDLKVYLKDNGWDVLEGDGRFLVMNVSPLGEDVRWVVRAADLEDAVASIQEFAAEFDPERHLARWRQAKENGRYVTTRLGMLPGDVALREDATAIKEMLQKLVDGMSDALSIPLDVALAGAVERSDEQSLRFVDNRMKAVLSGDAKDDPGYDEYDLV